MGVMNLSVLLLYRQSVTQLTSECRSLQTFSTSAALSHSTSIITMSWHC